ncbi:hypothetical protein BCEP27_30320 [Burkholderia cepacia]
MASRCSCDVDGHGTLAGSHYRTVLLNDDATMQASVGNPVNVSATPKRERRRCVNCTRLDWAK